MAQGSPSADRPLTSQNSMFWRVDARVAQARQHPGWARFHRACGEAGLFFDDIESARGRYGAITFRLGRTQGDFSRHLVSTGRGAGPIEAVLSAFDAAVEGGWPVDPGVGDLLRRDAAVPVAAAAREDVILDDLLGDPPLIEDWELA